MKKSKSNRLKTGSDEWYAHFQSYAKRQTVEWELYAIMQKVKKTQHNEKTN